MSAHISPAPVRRVRVHHLAQAKARGERITMLTAYDAVTGHLFDAAGIDMLLVGDSIGNTMHGHSSTIPVTVDDLMPAARAVAKVAERALVVVDLPFGSYEAGPTQALATAVRFLKEAGVAAVKLEGGRRIVPQIRALTDAGIPVVGHLGFTPQSENILGGPRVQARVTKILQIPTIGIGAGPHCDGQVLVWTDMAGMTSWSPRFARRYAELGNALRGAAAAYADDVRSGGFPGAEHSFEG
jgi:3-methyl-2-oxobutanoate hydroxymethyltransferase